MKSVVDMGIHEKTAILAGILVPKTMGMLKYMNSSAAGVNVSENIIKEWKKRAHQRATTKNKLKRASKSPWN